MKKILLFAATIALVGAGCLGGGNKPVEGDWVLTFDLPKDWVMVAPYQDEDIDLETGIERTDSEVWLQENDATTPVIKVSHLDTRRVIPSEAEDLGDGFFRQTVCDEAQGQECLGVEPYEYYLESESSKYKFIIDTELVDRSTVEDIIFSAEETEAPETDYGFTE